MNMAHAKSILFFVPQQKLSDMLLASDRMFVSLVSPTATDRTTIPTMAKVRDGAHRCYTITVLVHFSVLGVSSIIVAICWVQ